VVELPSPFAGVIKELHEQPGSVVEVGKPIVSFEVPDDAGTAPSGPAGGLPAGLGERGAETQKREPNLVGYGAVVEGSGRPARRPRNFAAPVVGAVETTPVHSAPVQARPAVVEPAGTKPVDTAAADRPRSTPPVRKLARDLGVDLARVPGTGPGGLITREDVRGFAGRGEEPVVPTAEPVARSGSRLGERETRTPIKGVRKYTAAAMVQSAFTAPHATEFLTVDVTPSLDLLARLKNSREFAGLKLTPLTLAAKAVLVALHRNPALNSHWDEEHQEIVTYNYVNLGIAAATPRGLTVPNIKDADTMQLPQLAQALTSLAETARAGKTTPAELAGGTISITNIGVFGIDAGTPILNPGEAAILGLGAVRTLPWEYRGEVALRQVITLSLSFDHRLVDGEQGSRFLADVGAILAEPGMVLTMV
jgi:pyruvate dehydrogenase E2 component (dihydrolipoamide acetyltransferase)